MFSNPALRAMCIAFRGTEQVKWKDLLTGAAARGGSFQYRTHPKHGWLPTRIRGIAPPCLAAVHGCMHDSMAACTSSHMNGTGSVMRCLFWRARACKDLSFQPAPFNAERVFDSMDSASLFQHSRAQARPVSTLPHTYSACLLERVHVLILDFGRAEGGAHLRVTPTCSG